MTCHQSSTDLSVCTNRTYDIELADTHRCQPVDTEVQVRAVPFDVDSASSASLSEDVSVWTDERELLWGCSTDEDVHCSCSGSGSGASHTTTTTSAVSTTMAKDSGPDQGVESTRQRGLMPQ